MTPPASEATAKSFWRKPSRKRVAIALFAAKVQRDSPVLFLICLLAGGLAAIPIDIGIGLSDLIALPGERRFSYADGGGDIYLDGVRTAYGWRDFAADTGITFAYGMLGGAIFWWIARPKQHAT